MINKVVISPQTDLKSLSSEERKLALKGIADMAEVATEAVVVAYLDNNDRFDLNPEPGKIQTKFQIGNEVTEQTEVLKDNAGTFITPGDIKEYKSYTLNDKAGEGHFASFENDKSFDIDGDGALEVGTLVLKGSNKGDKNSMTQVFYNNANKSLTVIEGPLPDNS